MMTKTQSMEDVTTLREKARTAVHEEVQKRAELEHSRNYHKLHIRRDGSIHWTESIDRASDIIDDGADHFAAVKSVVCVGTGSCTCNCDYCNDVYSADDEQLAKDEGRTYKADEKYPTEHDAIADAIANSDLTEIEQAMLEQFDEIEQGYFDDEQAAAVA
jgi:hypothetical protein